MNIEFNQLLKGDFSLKESCKKVGKGALGRKNEKYEWQLYEKWLDQRSVDKGPSHEERASGVEDEAKTEDATGTQHALPWRR